MKRSEAINIIKHTVLGLLEEKYRKDADFFSNQILRDLEEEGMLPPLSSENFDIKNDKGESIGTTGTFGYEWEPEK